MDVKEDYPEDCWECEGTGWNEDGGECAACEGTGKQDTGEDE